MGVKGIGQSEGDPRGAHQHVGESQVSNEEVGDVVHLAGTADDIQEQVVAKDSHQSHDSVGGDDEQLERLQQLHSHKLSAALRGAVLQFYLKCRARVVPATVMHSTQGVELRPPTAGCTLHPGRVLST